jgi:capsular polysaccharide biosynthesis protein
LANILFCAPGTKIVEIRPVNWVAQGGQIHIDRIAHACRHQYSSIDCLLASDAPSAAPVIVDSDLLRAALEGRVR